MLPELRAARRRDAVSTSGQHTPMLMSIGDLDPACAVSEVEETAALLRALRPGMDATVVVAAGKRGEMVGRHEQENLALMQFWARTLSAAAPGKPGEFVEVS